MTLVSCGPGCSPGVSPVYMLEYLGQNLALSRNWTRKSYLILMESGNLYFYMESFVLKDDI